MRVRALRFSAAALLLAVPVNGWYFRRPFPDEREERRDKLTGSPPLDVHNIVLLNKELKDAQKTLGVAPGASCKEIAAAYRAAARIHYTDDNGDIHMFHRITDAYELLYKPCKPQLDHDMEVLDEMPIWQKRAIIMEKALEIADTYDKDELDLEEYEDSAVRREKYKSIRNHKKVMKSINNEFSDILDIISQKSNISNEESISKNIMTDTDSEYHLTHEDWLNFAKIVKKAVSCIDTSINRDNVMIENDKKVNKCLKATIAIITANKKYNNSEVTKILDRVLALHDLKKQTAIALRKLAVGTEPMLTAYHSELLETLIALRDHREKLRDGVMYEDSFPLKYGEIIGRDGAVGTITDDAIFTYYQSDYFRRTGQGHVILDGSKRRERGNIFQRAGKSIKTCAASINLINKQPGKVFPPCVNCEVIMDRYGSLNMFEGNKFLGAIHTKPWYKRLYLEYKDYDRVVDPHAILESPVKHRFSMIKDGVTIEQVDFENNEIETKYIKQYPRYLHTTLINVDQPDKVISYTTSGTW